MVHREELLLSTMPPTRRQLQVTAMVAVALFTAFIATLPFGSLQITPVPSFIPIVDTTLLLSDLITATLLFAQVSVVRSPALLALASGYLFTGLIIVPHALTFPGAFAETGLLGAGVNTTIWLYYFWHTGLPLAVIAYAALKARGKLAIGHSNVQNSIIVCIAATLIAVVALTFLATAGHSLLPSMMYDAVNWSWTRLYYVAAFLLILLVLAIGLVWRGRRSVLDLWLMVALWAWLIELLLVMGTDSRYSLLWYAGRTYGLLSGVFVLLMLLSETTRIYARLALSVISSRREKEGRLMTMDAVAASIAHEVKQPLAAMVTNASVGLRWLDQTPPGIDQARNTLNLIAKDGHRAADVLGSIRAVLGQQKTSRVPTDLNRLVREAAALMSAEFASQSVSADMLLQSGLPPVIADHLQMQQVFLNLFTNATEAMRDVYARDRILVVRSERVGAHDVMLTVEDTGSGIGPESTDRIFDAFYTTKPGGTGMGLPLCRSIIESHGGDLSIAPREPFGTKVLIRLPLNGVTYD
ncbi:MASE4 domain-containing protein [Rhodopseudomonas sp. BR0G17]|uniref:sensor histidine kinase n=1 Tax=Rhodopseudomonas sp. BR0G17 TaxID=2269368 RepID=UPI0013DFAC48|nr:MASE4 domain-containing protein [Rhodopseudomonas sp. BR0G17]NEW97130.1 GHKL domain-containing protein [Rhodopseudomonas sp. BR0G17]